MTDKKEQLYNFLTLKTLDLFNRPGDRAIVNFLHRSNITTGGDIVLNLNDPKRIDRIGPDLGKIIQSRIAETAEERRILPLVTEFSKSTQNLLAQKLIDQHGRLHLTFKDNRNGDKEAHIRKAIESLYEKNAPEHLHP